MNHHTPTLVEHVVADVVFAPIRTMDPSDLICLCGETLHEMADELPVAFAQHRNEVKAERNTHRSSLGPRAVAEGFDFGRRLR